MSTTTTPTLPAGIAAAVAVAVARLVAGTVVDARPWEGGWEAPAAERGIVLGRHSEDYLLVWFPGRGGVDAPSAVQIIMISKILLDGGNPRSLADLPKTWVAKAYRLAKDANRLGTWTWLGAGAAIQRQAEANRVR